MASTILSWSTGKDAAWALRRLQRDNLSRVTALITTYQETDGRIGVHGVPVDRAREHAARLRLPLIEVPLPVPCPNTTWRERFLAALARPEASGAATVAFGDLFLEDIRAFREELLAGSGFSPDFPLWRENTERLAREMIDGGMEARIVAVDPDRLDPDMVGQNYDMAFIRQLPGGVDPCGERGEFHTLVLDGPMFRAH